jgi:hypothetical protein
MLTAVSYDRVAMNAVFRGALIALLVAGCTSKGPSGVKSASAPTAVDWRKVATAADRQRLRDWRTAFTTALRQARLSHAAQVANQGVLLEPDAAIADPDGIPPGAYRCRVIKLGAKSAGMSDYTAYPAFNCDIADEGEVSSFTKTSGSQRPVGLVFNDDGGRQIFLGTLMLGDETQAIDYGRDADRDMAGAVEKIGPRRWRMLLPWPRFESMMDVIELVPAS